MNEVSDGLNTEETSSNSLLSAFESAGDLDGLFTPDEEAPKEPAEAVQDAETPDTGDDETEETEVEAKEDDADEAESDEADDDGDFIEFELEDGTSERVSVAEALASHQQLQQLGAESEQIRAQIADAAQAEITQVKEAYNNQVQQVAQAWGVLNELMPNVQMPDQSLITTDPHQYAAQLRNYELVQERYGAAREKIQEAQQAYQQQQQEEWSRQANSNWQKLVSLDKSWAEGKPAERLETLRSSIAGTYGIERTVIDQITEPGFIRMAEDAAAYRAAKGKKVEAKAKTAPKLVKGGKAGRSTANPMAARKAKANAALKKTGEALDLEAVWGSHLD